MVSVIIPTLNAEDSIDILFRKLLNQTFTIDEIIIVDSESNDNTVNLCKNYAKTKILSVKRSEFDHGKTRDMALRQSKGDIVVFMTQDAVPANDNFIEKLIIPFMNDPMIAIVSGRQLARKNATKTEKLVREFNYPAKSNVRDKNDIPKYGIKTFFSSDVCAAYRRDIYMKVGGFIYPLKTNEDMFMAASVINAGYKIMYAADAQVIHSHNFTLKQQYDRKYIQGFEMEHHKDLLGDVSANSEGMKMVKTISKQLLRKGYIVSFVKFGLDCCARYLGNRKGRESARSIG